MSSFTESDSDALALNGSDRWLTSARLVSRENLSHLLEEHRPYLKRIAEREVPPYLLSRFDSSDVVQETMLRAFRQFDQFAGGSDVEFVAWMRGILLNQIIDTIRHHGRSMRDVTRDLEMPASLECDKSIMASELLLQKELKERMQTAMGHLADEYREVLMLRQEQDLSFSEIGKRMNRSSDAVRMLWGRAVLQLAKMMNIER